MPKDTTKKTELEAEYDRHLALGRKPLAILPKNGAPTKGPSYPGWPAEAGSPENRARLCDGANLGLLNGVGDRPLADVDLDHDELVELAQQFLPGTQMIGGRRTRPMTHRWYVAIGGAPPTVQFKDPETKEVFLELRGEGTQTVIPPSIHPDGDHYEWTVDGDPAEVDAFELNQACHQLAAAFLLNHTFGKGNRHEPAKFVAGIGAKAGIEEADLLHFLLNLVNASGGDARQIEANVRTTYDRYRKEENITGFEALKEDLGAKRSERFTSWLCEGHGVEPPTNSKEKLPPREEMIAILSRAPNPLSLEAIARQMGISKRMLRKHMENERQAENRVREFKQGRLKFLAVRRGTGMVAMNWSDPVRHEVVEAAHLPEGFRKFIGPRNGLPPTSFVLYQGGGDAWKTGFLLNAALANARTGKSTLLVTHEQQLDALRLLMARRLLGRSPTSAEEARDACTSDTFLTSFLEIRVVPGTCHVDEFAEEILAEDPRPQVVVYDYLNQSLMTVDKGDQESRLANIVQRLGQSLVDQGIPLITACQTTTQKGVAYAPETWEQRATVVLRVQEVESEQGGDVHAVYLRVRKNKAGFDRQVTKNLVMRIEGESHRVLSVEAANDHKAVQTDSILEDLGPSFTETDLREAVSGVIGKGARNPEVRKATARLIQDMERDGRIEPTGSRWKKLETPVSAFEIEELDLAG